MTKYIHLIAVGLFFSILVSTMTGQVIYRRILPSLQSLPVQKSFQIKKTYPKVGLVLSGGGARGISHVGVLKGLEKHNIPIDMIVGASMGSVMGGFYAAGFTSAQLESIIKSIQWNEIFSDNTQRENLFLGQKVEQDRYIITIRFDKWNPYIPSSISTGQKILSIITEQLYQLNIQRFSDFDSLRIPFRAIATDLISGKRVVLTKGDLAEAIYGSTAVPLLFSPMRWKDMLLVDGGLSSNLPVDVARAAGMERVILVDISSPLRTVDELKAPWEIADQVTTIMQQSQYQEQRGLADIVIKPDLENIGSSDFSRYNEMITEGEKAVERNLARLENLILNKGIADTTYADRIKPRTYIWNEIQQSTIQTSRAFENSDSVSLQFLKNLVDSAFSTGIYKEISIQQDLNDTTILTINALQNPVIRQVQFSGDRLYSDSLLNKCITHPLNTVLNYTTILQDLNNLNQMYMRAGYGLMNFQRVELDTSSGILQIKINTGMIDSIKIEGNDITKNYVILREFPLKEKSFFNSRLVKQGMQNIYDTQLFDKATINVDAAKTKNRLIIKVGEKKYTALNFGGNISLDRGVQTYLAFGNDNFQGIGSSLWLSGRIGEKDKNAGLNFRIDRVFKTYFTAALYTYYDFKINPFLVNLRKIGEYWEERIGGKLIIGQQLRKLGQMNIELRIENVKDRRYSGEFNYSKNSELRTLSIRSVTDKRNKIAFPSKGIYNIWYWEAGNERIIGGQEKYTKAYVKLEGFYTYKSRYTLHLRGGIGVADKTLPFPEYFRLGGIEEFMGLYEYEYMGRQLIYSNLEFRYKLPFKIVSDAYIALRYDLAGIWETPDLIMNSEDFFPGYGAWFGIDTFLGPIMAGYGQTRDKSGIFYLSFGYRY
jgi:NTE family protein